MTQKGKSFLQLGTSEYIFVTNFFKEHLVLRVEWTLDLQSIIIDYLFLMKMFITMFVQCLKDLKLKGDQGGGKSTRPVAGGSNSQLLWNLLIFQL